MAATDRRLEPVPATRARRFTSLPACSLCLSSHLARLAVVNGSPTRADTRVAFHLEANRQLVHRYFDLLNGRDLSIAEEILAPEVVFVGPRDPEGVRGREAFIEFVAASPDVEFGEGETVAEGDRVASVFTMTRSITARRRAAEESSPKGIDLFQIADGSIERINAYFDRMRLLGRDEPPPRA